MQVTGFEWDDVNITHIAKHQLAPEEVVFEHLGRGRIRVITAREMSQKEKKRFRRR